MAKLPVIVTQDHIDRGVRRSKVCALSLAIGQQHGVRATFKIDKKAMKFIKAFDNGTAEPTVLMMDKLEPGAYGYELSRETYGPTTSLPVRI